MGIFLYIIIGICSAGFTYWCAKGEAANEEEVVIALKIVILTAIWPLIVLLIAGFVVKLLVDKFGP